MAVRERLSRIRVELPILALVAALKCFPRAVPLLCRERPAIRRPRIDVPRSAGVGVEVEPVEVEQAHVWIVIGVVLTVTRVADDFYDPVVSRGTASVSATGVRGRRAARGQKQHGDTHEDRYVTSCLAHSFSALPFLRDGHEALSRSESRGRSTALNACNESAPNPVTNPRRFRRRPMKSNGAPVGGRFVYLSER